VRIAVVGVGHLGRIHARLLAENPRALLVGVADPREEALRDVTAQRGVPGFTDYRELAPLVDAVCVVVPTHLHRAVSGFFLEHGIDVLVEKPIAPTVEDGQALVAMARARGLILQVGHIERFNPAMRAISESGIEPRYIESHRLAPFTFRSTDIGVVLDLMIHDLDLVLALVGSPVRSVDAFGGAVFTPAEDMASAILKFENGAVAHLTANRVALKPMRRMRLFSRDAYASLDFGDGRGVVIRKGPGWDFTKLDLASVDPTKIDDLWKFVFEGLLTVNEFRLDETNPLQEELSAFLTAVQERSEPVVSGEDGCHAVAVAHQVLDAIRRNPW
jgi:predicted dehydrogenase